VEAERVVLVACEAIHKALAGLRDVPEDLAPKTDAATAIRRVLSLVAGEHVPPTAKDSAIEMLGWLELPLDDAAALIITNFNEGFLPSSHASDQFLPNRLRNHLGVADSARQYARDLYSLSVLLASADVTLVVGRHDREHNPLAPSRLLFATDQERIAARAMTYFKPPTNARQRQPLGGVFTPRPDSLLEVPAPLPLAEQLPYLRVTDFRSYLECPYRFYLRRALKLASLDDAAEELDGRRFGNLLHDVLKCFGSDAEAARLEQPEKIADWLATALSAMADETLGTRRLAMVNVQIEQLRLRLNKFAEWQGRRTCEGWRIAQVEGKVEQTLTFEGESAVVQGRIDRIDCHPDTHQWQVLDYKSADRGESPDRTHRRRNEWVDLQLPLYRRLAQGIAEIDGAIEVGYVLLPRDLKAVGESLASWGDADWKSADAVAAKVVAGIRQERFWPPNGDVSWPDDELAAVCQSNILGRRLGQWPAEAAV
jgi:hypothetical protein